MLCPPLRTVLPSTPNFTGLVAAPSMHKLTSLSKFGGRWQHHQCTSSHRFQSLEEGRHQLADQPDAVHQLALDEHSQPSEKGEWVYLSRTNYIEWISFTRLTWTRSEAAETARPHTSNWNILIYYYVIINRLRLSVCHFLEMEMAWNNENIAPNDNNNNMLYNEIHQMHNLEKTPLNGNDGLTIGTEKASFPF